MVFQYLDPYDPKNLKQRPPTAGPAKVGAGISGNKSSVHEKKPTTQKSSEVEHEKKEEG